MRAGQRAVLVAILGLVATCVTLLGYLGSVSLLSFFDPYKTAECLQNGHKAEYEVLEHGDPGVAKVRVRDVSGQLVWEKKFSVPSTKHVKSYELHQCAIYIHNGTGLNPVNGKADPGYFWSLWKYPYYIESDGDELVKFSENLTGKREDSKKYYGTQFRINPSETFISLERGYPGSPDYALVIKDIETKEGVFALSMKNVVEKQPSAAGTFSVGKWVERPEGEYLVSEIFDSARETAFVYIKTDTWESAVYPTPQDLQAGVERAYAPFEPMIAYTDIITWAGFKEVTDAIMDEYLAEGVKKHLTVQDLKTGERIVLEEVPLVRDHKFKLLWLSDTELQYVLPSGEVKTWRSGDSE